MSNVSIKFVITQYNYSVREAENLDMNISMALCIS